jgi:hypothetical protein
MSSIGQTRAALRVCVVRDGKVCDEHLLRQGSALAIRQGELVPAHLTDPDAFCRAVGSGWSLHLVDGDNGRIKKDGEIVEINVLRDNPMLHREHERVQIRLAHGDRGHIRADGASVLFQVVGAPMGARNTSATADFRPRCLDDDDPVFLAFVGVFAMAGAAAALLVTLAPTPPAQTFTFETAKQVVLRLREQQVEPKQPEPPATVAQLEPPDGGPAAPVAPPTKPDPPKAPNQAALIRSRPVIVLVGSRRTLGNIKVDDTTELLPQGWGTSDDIGTTIDGPRHSLTTHDYADRGIADDDLSVQILYAPTTDQPIDVPVTITIEPPQDVAENHGLSSISERVNAQSGRLKVCYENLIRSQPGMKARIEMSWSVTRGRVTSLQTLSESTDDDVFVSCIEKKLRGFRFQGVDDGLYGPWPFVFRSRP